MHSLFKNGYCNWLATDLADQLQVDDLEFDPKTSHISRLPTNNQDYVKTMLNVLHNQIALTYIQPYAHSYELLESDIKGNLPKDSKFCQFHSDADEPSNVFFLLYFNDMSEIKEGGLYVGDDVIYPRYGELIAVLNDNPKILHRAGYTEHRRIVACFDFIVNWNHESISKSWI
jgi:hypothetical protein